MSAKIVELRVLGAKGNNAHPVIIVTICEMILYKPVGKHLNKIEERRRDVYV